jgi:hypothetical protein
MGQSSMLGTCESGVELAQLSPSLEENSRSLASAPYEVNTNDKNFAGRGIPRHSDETVYLLRGNK